MPWYKRWFSEERYLDVYSHRDEKEAGDVIDLFRRTTQLPESSVILDLACGSGRHAFELAGRGYSVIAADLSAMLLNHAQRDAPASIPAPAFIRADMRSLPFRSAFDAVVQLFTAFGYFANNEQDAEVLRQVWNVLEPRGWYLLDFLNSHEVRRTLIPLSEQAMDGGFIRQERRIYGNRVEKLITVHLSGETRSFTESVRLYTPDELTGMLEKNGFSIEHCFGSYDGAVFEVSSPRCILFSRKR
jgi:ubiquinone/menaquinone biosynthesis C-methylase UbiE